MELKNTIAVIDACFSTHLSSENVTKIKLINSIENNVNSRYNSLISPVVEEIINSLTLVLCYIKNLLQYLGIIYYQPSKNLMKKYYQKEMSW